jgi:hypothetical protein
MPPSPKKKADKEKQKKKKVKANLKPSAEKDIEVPVSNPPTKDQPTINVEAPSTEDPAPMQEKNNSSSQDPGAQVKFSCP